MSKINCSIVFAFLFLLGCANQSGESSSANQFNQIKAAKTRVSLGLTYLKNGNFSQAKFNLDKALEFAPRSADVNYALAYYYQKVEEIEQAEAAYQYAMDLDPRNADITNSYGAFLCQNGKYEEAKKYFLKAINTSNYISSGDTYENLALCSQSSGRTDEAVEYLRSAVNHQPGRANSLYLLAQALVDTQQWQEARDVLRRYEKVAQVSPESLLMAIQIEKGSGNYATAKEFRDMLIKVYPQHPQVLALLKDKPDVAKPTRKLQKLPRVKTKKVLSPKETPVVETAVENKADLVAPVQEPAIVAITEPNPINESSVDPVAESKIENQSDQIASVSESESPVIAEPQITVEPTVVTELSAEPAAESDEVKTDELLEASQEVAEAEQDVKNTPEIDYHIVAKGENLYRISLMYNIKMQRLVEWNGLSDASAIYQGMKLKILAPNSDE